MFSAPMPEFPLVADELDEFTVTIGFFVPKGVDPALFAEAFYSFADGLAERGLVYSFVECPSEVRDDETTRLDVEEYNEVRS